METSKVNQLLEGWTAFAREENGCNIYYVLPQEMRRDAETGYRVLHIGCPTDRPTRCVLLLGETGAGKTTFVNAVLNYLFGVKFSDSFRLQVKEEIEEGRLKTASQTDTITAYAIHYKKGMKHEYNFVLIDTPGLADTRGAQHQKRVRSCLEAFLTTENVGVDELHCVGLVAKGNINRDFASQKAMLGDIISLLGNNVPEITCIIATFAVDEPSVDDVVRNAGITFTNVFPLDNGILYAPRVMSSCSERRHTALALRWEDMKGQYDTFFTYLGSAPSVSNRILREKKLFDTCKKNLKKQINELAILIAALNVDKKLYKKYELQEGENKGWMKDVMEEKIIYTDPGDLPDGLHPHNCKKCQQTCHMCIGSVEDETVGAIACGTGAVAGGVASGALLASEGTAVVATAGAATVASEAAVAAGATVVASEAAAAAGAAAVASEAAAAAGAVAVASETAAATAAVSKIATVTAASAGGLLVAAGALAIGAGYFICKIVDKKKHSCGMESNHACTGRGCHHQLSDHVREKSIITKTSEKKKKINENMKKLYDEAVSKKSETNNKINRAKENMLSRGKIISQITVKLLHHAKRIQEFTSQSFDYIKNVPSQIINDLRQGKADIMPHVIKLVNVVEEAMRQLASSTAEEVLGKEELVEKMLLNIYSKH